MRAFVLLCLLALVANGLCADDANEFGVSIPDSFFSGIFNRVLFPLLDDYGVMLGRNFPTDCCYHKLGVKVQIQNLTENNLHASSTVSSSSSGISMMADMGVNWDFHFKLCTQVGKKCTPLFFCNDDVVLQFNLKLAALMNASASADGHLVLSAPNASIELDIDYGNLCATVKEIIAGIVATVNKDLNILFPKIANGILGAISEVLTLSLQFGDAELQVLYSDSETGTTKTGLAAGGRVVVTNAKTGKEGTFTPSSPLPDLLTSSQPVNEEELFLSDSVPNNILEALFDGTFPNHFKLNVYLQGNLFKLHFNLREAPQVSFSSKGSSIIVKTREVIQDGLLRIDFNVDTQIFFEFGHDGNKIFLSLNPDNFIFDVELLPPVDPNIKNITGLIDQAVEQQWQKYIPILDTVLREDYAIPLPPIPFFSFPGMEDFNGYARLFVENKPPQKIDNIFAKMAKSYPKTAAMLQGMALEAAAPARKVLELFGEKLAEALEDVEAETATRDQRAAPMGVKKDSVFYCPQVIPGFSVEPCPTEE